MPADLAHPLRSDLVPNVGHMLHHSAPERAVAAIHRAALAASFC